MILPTTDPMPLKGAEFFVVNPFYGIRNRVTDARIPFAQQRQLEAL
jgi:hypothetical protein